MRLIKTLYICTIMQLNLKSAIIVLIFCFLFAIIIKVCVVAGKSDSSIEDANEITSKAVNIPGGSSIYWIKDNKGQKLFPCNLFVNASDSLCQSLELSKGIPAAVNTFLLKVDGEYILFDAGLGDLGGQSLKNLEKINVTPDSIKLIYLTHLHLDHISGLITKSKNGEDEKVFKNSVLYISKPEYEAWTSALTNNDLQKKILGMYRESIRLFEFGDKLPHNIQAIDAVGHTPGHTAFQYKQILIVGDLMHGYALQKDHLDINSNYDMDKQKSVESRKRLVTYAKKNNLTLAGMHLPHFGFVK